VLDWNEKDSYPLLVDILQADGVVLAESDTVLGLFAQLSEKSKKRLDTIKQRSLKPYIILLKSAELVYDFTDQYIDASMQQIMDRHWPGPLTILFKAKATLPDWMVGLQGTVAIRVPKHEGLQKLLQNVDALFTTSANISDQPIPDRYAYVNSEVLNQVQLVCCHPDKIYDGPASTIVDFSSGSIKVVRLGVVKIDSI
jgi:L-threonylcarbamoyladenylate synthase